MVVHHCDNCQKVINKSKRIIISRDIYGMNYIELCFKCAAPVMSIVDKSQIAPELKKKIKEKPRLRMVA